MTCGRVFQHHFISKANLKNPEQRFLVHRFYLLRKQKIVSGKAGFQFKSDRIWVVFLHSDSLWHPLHTKEGDEISMFLVPCLQSSISTLSFSFLALFFAMQLALVTMITITPTLSMSVFSLQRTRLFRTCGELWRTRGELWLYFEMQRQHDLWSFS